MRRLALGSEAKIYLIIDCDFLLHITYTAEHIQHSSIYYCRHLRRVSLFSPSSLSFSIYIYSIFIKYHFPSSQHRCVIFFCAEIVGYIYFYIKCNRAFECRDIDFRSHAGTLNKWQIFSMFTWRGPQQSTAEHRRSQSVELYEAAKRDFKALFFLQVSPLSHETISKVFPK